MYPLLAALVSAGFPTTSLFMSTPAAAISSREVPGVPLDLVIRESQSS